MPRPPKSLEEQLRLAEEELQKTLAKAERIREKIETINEQIEDRDMREIYALTKERGVSVEQLKAILEKNN